MGRNKAKVGLLGLGTVGTGVWKIIRDHADILEQRAGTPIEVVRVLVKDAKKKRAVDIPPEVLTTDPSDILDNPEIDIVVELMGGLEPARDYIIRALRNGKNVVTANKDVLATSGRELFDAAAEHGRDLLFEGSVAGGIPIIRPLKECLAANRIEQVMGIINGTTNFILTKMTQEGRDFNEVLAEAQALGYAEADPTADVGGLDAARKIAILASIAFNTRVTLDDVYVEGITGITSQDIQYARELGYVIKLLGIGKESSDGVEVRVHPAFIPTDHPLASVNDVFNAIYVKGNAVGDTMFYGRGAGEMPTASAVVGDIITVARDIRQGVTGRLACTCYEHKPVKTIGDISSKYYLRMLVREQPGVLGNIASVFGSQGVSLFSVIQKRTEKNQAEIVLITHQVQEKYFQDALAVIRSLPSVASISSVIRVEGGDI
ncbi:MAG: homoserine dehydrogenase [Bacillota bacterium]